jgi:hypothetical protein
MSLFWDTKIKPYQVSAPLLRKICTSRHAFAHAMASGVPGMTLVVLLPEFFR